MSGLSNILNLLAGQAPQFLLFLGLAAVVLLLAAVAQRLEGSAFPRYFGRLHPLLAVSLVALVGLAVWGYLLPAGLAVYRAGNLAGLLLGLGLALPFATVMILVDRRAPFPPDLNVLPPAGYFFYPVVGFVVEVLFHLLPFAALYALLGFLPGIAPDLRLGLSIAVSALLEPLFQLALGTDHNTRPVLALMVLFLFFFNLTQLGLFVRYDFASMYALRLGYYLLWHILWGQRRLGLLF